MMDIEVGVKIVLAGSSGVAGVAAIMAGLAANVAMVSGGDPQAVIEWLGRTLIGVMLCYLLIIIIVPLIHSMID
jgi:hypothetical protein